MKGLTKKQTVSAIKKGKDLGKPGAGFKKGVAAIEKKGLSKEAAQKIMGAQLWKKQRAGKLTAAKKK